MSSGARGVDLALDAAVSQTDALATALDRGLSRARDRCLDLAGDLERSRHLCSELAAVRARVRTENSTRDLRDDVTWALEEVRGLAEGIISSIDSADIHWMTSALDRIQHRAADVGSVVEQCYETIERDFPLLGQIVEQRDATMELSEPISRPIDRPAGRAPGKTLQSVTAIACGFLPVSHRDRYNAEFCSELFELPRSRRLIYAFRIVRATPAIRASLRASRVPEESRGHDTA